MRSEFEIEDHRTTVPTKQEIEDHKTTVPTKQEIEGHRTTFQPKQDTHTYGSLSIHCPKLRKQSGVLLY